MKNFLNTAVLFAFLATAQWALAQKVAELSATTGAISEPFILTNGCIFQPSQTASTNGGKAVFRFTVPASGQYALRAVVKAPGTNSNVLFINIDSEPVETGMKWEIPVRPDFCTNWVLANSAGLPKWFDLTPGAHEIIVRGCDANVQLAELSVWSLPVTRPAPPTGLRVVTGQ